MKEEFYKVFNLTEHPSSIENEEEREKIKEEIYQRVRKSIDAQYSQKKPFGTTWFFSYKAAAILIAVFTFLWAGYVYYTKRDRKTEYITVQAKKGEVLEVLLPDHSKIILNAASSIRYPSKFISTRDIYLEEGEAYFDVAHDAAKPFIVHTGGISTKVLGTAFNIKSYKKLPNITITVTRGKVQVNEKSKILNTLRPDEQLTFNKTNHLAMFKNVKSANMVTWMNGNFNLDGVYFNEIMLVIENRFNVKAIYNRKVFNNCQNSIRFTKKQSLTDVLKVLRTIQPIHYSIKNDSLFISGKPCY